MKSILRALVLLALTFPIIAIAQDTASITGTVADATGAAVAGAQVEIASPEHGVQRSAATNGSGEYLFAALPIGSYDLTVTAPGFKKYGAKGIVLRVGQKARNDVPLQVGATTTEVTVQGENVAQVETQTNEVAGTITGKEISQLQLNGRVFTQLVTLTPGVSNQTGTSEGQVGITANTNYSVNGGRLEYNNWELDGGDNMDNGSNATLNVTPSIDAIGEVRVLTSNYGAQYGRNGSGTVETETKSGTSAFHGDVYEFVRNDMFNATPEFQSSVPSYKKNDFGYTIGGPVFIPRVYNTSKQKTFFFFSEEWRKDRVPGQNFNQIVPSVAERGIVNGAQTATGDFSDVCPGVDCPSGGPLVPIDPNALPLLAMIPLPSAGFTNVYNAAPAQPTNWREELIRVDHNLNDKNRIMFRYAHDSWDTISATPLWTNAGSFPTVETNFVGPALSLVGRVTTTFSPSLLNEFVFSYTTDHIVLTSTGSPDPNAWKRTSSYTAGSLFPTAPNGGKLPGFSVAGGSGGAYGSDGFGQDPGYIPNGPYNSNPTYTYRDNMTKIIGRHNLQFGAYFVAAQKNELSATEPSTNGFLSFDNNATISSGNSFADLLMGNIASFGQASAQPKYYNRYKIVEPYFQDDFHITRNLTLNLGMRLSLFQTYRERFKNAYNFDPAAWNAANAPQVDDANGDATTQAGAIVPGTGDPFNGMARCGAGGVPAGCMKGHLFNPAPRIGFAWDPAGDGKTAIRGGYGIFFDHTNGNEADTEALEGAPPLVNTPTQYNIAGYAAIGSQGGLLFPLNVISIPSKAVWPYMQQWHFDVQHDIARNTIATVSYVGSKGTHLGRKYELNQLGPVPVAQNPYIALGTPIDSNGDCGSISESINGNGQVVASGTVNGQPVSQSVATHLAVACQTDANPFRPFRGFGSITRLDNGASSVYHALQTSLRRNVGALQVNVSYTYSHSIDDASDGGLFGDGGILNAFDIARFRASSNFDQRHLLSASYVYDLPNFKNAGFARTVLGGWEYSGIAAWQTGTPFSVYNGADTPDNAGLGNNVSGNSGAGQSYADLVSDPHQNIPHFSPLNGFGPFVANPNAFGPPVGLTLGNTTRNFLRNPGHWNIDMALYKRFAITERVGFEFRAEAFNIFNHVEYGPLGGDQGGAAGSAGFSSGTASFVQGPYSVAGAPDAQNQGAAPFLQKGVAYSPRILQFGAKLIF